MEHYTSLLLFTFTGQTAIGLILSRELMIMAGALRRYDEPSRRSQYLITLLLLIALITAFFHLGRPMKSVYALNNLRHSPLSMEIASLSLLLVTAATRLWLQHRSTVNSLTRLLPAVEVAAGLLLLLTMTAVYMLPSVPAWFNLRTPLAFVLTVISAGTVAMALVAARWQTGMARLMAVVGAIAVIAMAVSGLKGGNSLPVAGRTIFYFQVMTALAAFVLAFASFRGSELNKTRRMTVITAILVLISGFSARLLFFLSYDNTIL